jgi:NAD(P)-dependent dehydrogenase (short-subunit alcohol dehydrogenase family)
MGASTNGQAFNLKSAGERALSAARSLVAFRDYQFKGKVVVITGGSRGLGLVMARMLAREGARLAILARDQDELARAHEELAALTPDVLALTCDVTDRLDVETAVRLIVDRLGPVDVLINNAGVIQVGPMETMTLDDYEEAMKTHFWGPLFTTLAVLPEMRARREGRIVNISSIGGKVSVPHLLPYSASKFALTGLSEGLRAELLKDNILVTTACPGLMRTGSPRNATFKGQHRAEYAWFSISDSLPFTSTSAESAAARILKACRRGEAEVVVTPQAKLAARVAGVFPGFVANVLGLVNAVLPAPGGVGALRVRGKDSESALSPSLLTVLGDKAALRNNEVASSG